VLDRTNGKDLVSVPYSGGDWSNGVDEKGQPVPNADREPKTDGSLINIPAIGGTNWFPPSFDPQTGLFYVNSVQGYSLAYLTDTDERPEGYGGSGRTLLSQSVVKAIDYKTGHARWTHEFPGRGQVGSGFLSTAGHLLFSGDGNGNLIAWNPENGNIIWHFKLPASVSNGPTTYVLDGRQYLLVGAGDTLYSFALLK
jgi:alcohol dehydrogenase (cytochrome c)